jgi:hypothetical protein
MSAKTVEGAVIELVRACGLVGGRAWSEDAPEGATRPYVTLLGPVSVTPRLRGDGGMVMGSERLVQMDLWQDRRHPRGGTAVDPTLCGQLVLAVDGADLSLDESVVGKIFRCHVQDLQRVAEPDESNLTHHAITLSIKHDRGAI